MSIAAQFNNMLCRLSKHDTVVLINLFDNKASAIKWNSACKKMKNRGVNPYIIFDKVERLRDRFSISSDYYDMNVVPALNNIIA